MRTSTGLSILATAWLVSGALALGTAAAEVELDSTFAVNGIALKNFGANTDDIAKDLLIQPDGKVLTGGLSISSVDGT